MAWRAVLPATLAVVGALLLALAPAALWLRFVALDTDVWVERTARLATDPELQSSVADAVTDSVLGALDIESRVDSVLPSIPGLDKLGPALAATVETAVRDLTHSVVRSEGFESVWRETNRLSHAAFVAGLTGRDGSVISAEPGTVMLDSGPLVERLGEVLNDRGLGLVADLSLERYSSRIVLLRSEWLAAAGTRVVRVQKAAVAIPVVAVMFTAAAFWLARNKLRILQLVSGVTAAAAFASQRAFVSSVTAVASRIEAATLIPARVVRQAADLVSFDLLLAWRILTVAGVAGIVVASVAILMRGSRTADV